MVKQLGFVICLLYFFVNNVFNSYEAQLLKHANISVQKRAEMIMECVKESKDII